MKRMNKFLLFAMFLLVLSPLITAQILDFSRSDVKSKPILHSKYPELTFEVNGVDVSKTEITFNTEQCLIDCEAIINTELYENSKLPYNFDFVDENGNPQNLSYKVYLLKKGSKTTQQQECISDNGSKDPYKFECYEYRYSNETITYDYWQEQTIDWTRIKGNYTMRIVAKKDPLSSIDWAFSLNDVSSDKVREFYAWWDSNWPYRKGIAFTGGGANVSVFANVSYEGNMAQTNFSDIRFTMNISGTEVEVDHWKYNSTCYDSSYCIVALPLESNTSGYLYYGNPSASEVSDIENVFWFGDDFVDASVDFVNRWQSTEQAKYTIDNYRLKAEKPSGSAGGIKTQISYSGDYATEGRVEIVAVATSDFYNMLTDASGSTFSGNNVQRHYAQDDIIAFNSGTPTQTYSSAFGGGEIVKWFAHIVNGAGASNITHTWDNSSYSGGGTMMHRNSTGTTDDDGYFGYLQFGGASDYDYVDWVYITKYDTYSATATFGTEEVLDVDSSPSASLQYPINEKNFTQSSIAFVCNASDDSRVVNLTLYINGTSIYTNSSITTTEMYLNYTVSRDNGLWNWTCYACDNATITQCDWADDTWNFRVNVTSPDITVNTPDDNFNTDSSSVTFNCSAETSITGGNVTNISLWVDGTMEHLQVHDTSNFTSMQTTETISEGDHTWYCQASDSDDSMKQSSSRALTVDLTSPVVNSSSGLSDIVTRYLPVNTSNWRFGVYDANIDACWYFTSDNETNTTITCNSFINTTWILEGQKNITYYANDTVGHESYDTTTITIYVYNYTQATDKETVGEGDLTTFNLTITMSDIPSTTANLVYNNTNYSATTSLNSNASTYYFERSIAIPQGWGNASGVIKQWYWHFSVTGIDEDDTDQQNQTIYAMDVTNCTDSEIMIYNFSLYDEGNNSLMTGLGSSINGSIIEVDVRISSIYDSSIYWDYATEVQDQNYLSICVPEGSINDSSYRVDLTAGLETDEHVKEFWYVDNGTISPDLLGNPYQIDLMDLDLDDSTTFLFTFYDEDGLTVPNIIVETLRYYIGDGYFKEVERSKEDDNGETHIHLVEEDVIYYFNLTQYGQLVYTSSQYNAKCLSTPCSITLNAEDDSLSAEIDDTYQLGTITTNSSTRIVSYSFSGSTQKTMNLSVYKYSNNPDEATLVGTDSVTATSGTLSVTVPQSSGNITFFAVLHEDNEYLRSEWVSLRSSGFEIFGVMGVFLTAIIVICAFLMSITEGALSVLFGILSIVFSAIMYLVDIPLGALIMLFVAGGFLIFKLIKRRPVR